VTNDLSRRLFTVTYCYHWQNQSDGLKHRLL